MTDTDDKLGNVWVIGASSGIGEGFARLIDGVADNVAISARSTDKLEKIQSETKTLTSFPVDVTSAEAMATTANAIEASFGSIDLVVLSSGFWAAMPADKLDLEKMHRAMDVNFFGAANMVSAVVPGMKVRRRGHIVIIASTSGYRGLPQAAAYGPTKAALMNFAETLKIDLEPFGISVSIVNPGFVDTPMTSINKFPMPGMISVDQAARSLLAGIRRKKFAILFPWLFANTVRLTNLVPNWLFFWGIRKMLRR